MIPSIIAELEQAHEQLHLSWRDLCAEVPYSSLMRWKGRLRAGQPPVQTPGPKKSQPLSAEFFRQLDRLSHGRSRTHGTTDLHRQFSQSISRRQIQTLARQNRHHQLQSMKRIHWLRANLAWSADATEYHGWKIIPLHDLASRYRVNAIISSVEDGAQIATFLETAFKEHGPPLFFKRDSKRPWTSATYSGNSRRPNFQSNSRPASITSIIGPAAASRAGHPANASMTPLNALSCPSRRANSFSGCALPALFADHPSNGIKPPPPTGRRLAPHRATLAPLPKLDCHHHQQT